MPVVSVINYKGGVGKTTVTANLGAELACRGYKVLIIDLDPQASLTFSFVSADYWSRELKSERTIKRWYDSFSSGNPLQLSELVIKPARVANRLNDFPNKGELDIVPSHLGLINVDLELATELGGATLTQSKLNYLKVHRRLADGLAANDLSSYDLILIDCPPNFNVVTKTAIAASNYILIPAKPDYLSTLGIDYLHRSLRELVKDYNEYVKLGKNEEVDSTIDPQILGVVFTMTQLYADQPISAQRPFMDQTKRLGVPVFEAFLRENKSVHADAPIQGIPVVLKSGTSSSNVVKELEEFTSEFIERIQVLR
ncbi:ParA family protein [Streptosporangium sp. 'caverna']|uniref:ParA family protein n=1 Tax=Streptosporangium sp. 'caverna' TaxID=2202249 RepID=UPI000D7DD681|nr:AAA family ATPase [Streptosporangium sp. 'caverna']AWS42954.1 cobyrinic acid a,c-diamide synthase [Streptosporangium sp. 'caverna']